MTAIDGPSYYGGRVGENILYATTAELCPSQKAKDAVLWATDTDGRPSRLARWRKDLFGIREIVRWFQPGLVLFPSGAVADAIPFTGSGLVGA